MFFECNMASYIDDCEARGSPQFASSQSYSVKRRSKHLRSQRLELRWCKCMKLQNDLKIHFHTFSGVGLQMLGILAL
jgi:hypothetical protein